MKPQNDTETISEALEVSTQILSPTFAGSLPVFLRLCFSMKPFPSGRLLAFRFLPALCVRSDLEVRKRLRSLFSLERR